MASLHLVCIHSLQLQVWLYDRGGCQGKPLKFVGDVENLADYAMSEKCSSLWMGPNTMGRPSVRPYSVALRCVGRVA